MYPSSEIIMSVLDNFHKRSSLRAFDLLNRLHHTLDSSTVSVGYPPSNLIQTSEDTWRIEMAIAGFKMENIEVKVDRNRLTVQSLKTEADAPADDQESKYPIYYKRGIAERHFEVYYDLADHTEVIGAWMDDGILTIDLKREIPEATKPKLIELKRPKALEDK